MTMSGEKRVAEQLGDSLGEADVREVKGRHDDATGTRSGTAVPADEYYLNQSAHLLGNYHKYYTFHSVASRIELLKDRRIFYELWMSCGSPDRFAYLDIGCNEGDLTLAVAQLIREELPSHVSIDVIGVDLDHSLIQLANDKVRLEAATVREGLGHCQFYGVDFTKENEIAEWRQTLYSAHNITHFHLISIFSTTMWIHVNGGDEGLGRFLLDARRCLVDSGVLLVEPQPTKCYRSAAKRCRKLGLPLPPFLSSIDKAHVNDTLTRLMHTMPDDCALTDELYLGTEDWGRPLRLFHNNKSFAQNTETISVFTTSKSCASELTSSKD